jgi:hypothetical protein
MFYVGNLEFDDLNHIYAIVFDGLPADAGTIYIDNIRFASSADLPPETIPFRNYDWWIKDTGCGRAGPGSNYFSDSNQNVWVDASGQLHLKIDNRAGKWYCAEVVNTDSLGYGTHVYTIKGRIDLLDPNVVLGLFTWDNDAPQYNYREIDIEFSKWWIAGEPNNAQYVIQPWDILGNRHRFHIDCQTNDTTTHEITWTPNGISFKSYYGEFPMSNPADLIESWVYSAAGNPPAGGENDRINLWLLPPFGSPEGTPGGPPTDNNEIEMVIASFNYLPLGDFNKDARCDAWDLGIFAESWLASPASPLWNPDCELASPKDNAIDSRDFTVLAGYWGKGKGL